MPRKKKEPGNGAAAALAERIELQADGTGKPEPTAEEITAVAQAAANATTTPAATTSANPKPKGRIAELLETATRAAGFGRSQMTPPKHRNGKCRAERHEIAGELEEVLDKVQAWIKIVPELVKDRTNMDPEKFRKSMAAFERAYWRLQDVLDELAVRRCKATSHSVAEAIEILEDPKWKGPTTNLANAKKVLNDLERVARTGQPFSGVCERGDTTAWTLWKLIKGHCYTCGSEFPNGFHGRFCDSCHKAFLAERRQAEQKLEAERRQAEQKLETDDADLLAQLSKQIKK